ncbi:MAG: helix-turn-helix transcriptional regulator [Bacteroidetes bacterium]|nr:helix-turn-helix transcriptional regulator [Bacteroidota bacterium]
MYLYQRIVKAKLFIDHHYAAPLDLDNISGQAYFSKYHFIRLFKSAYGKTPSNYLLQVRIDNAKMLLAKGLSVLDASMSVGFDSPTSFAGAFKKIVGVAPSVYQRKQVEKQKIIKENPLRYVPHCFVETHGLSK